MTTDEMVALLRRLATNRDTFTEWVISREETQAVVELVKACERVERERLMTIFNDLYAPDDWYADKFRARAQADTPHLGDLHREQGGSYECWKGSD